MKRIGWTALLLATAAIALVEVRTADACSSSCSLGAFVPGDGTTVPANLPALVWSPTYDLGQADLTQVTLTRQGPTGPVAIALTATQQPAGYYLLVPAEPLVAGATYQLVDGTDCFLGPSPRSTFTVTPAAPLPTRLGTLTATPQVQGTATLSTSAGSCSVEADIASVAVDLVYDPEAAPWRDVLHLQTYVDDRPWYALRDILVRPAPGASWVGRGTDRIYSVCANLSSFGSPSYDLPPGGHDVTMRATLPGATLDLTSSLTPIHLQCEGTVSPDDGGLLCDGGWWEHDGSPGGLDAGIGGSNNGDGGGCASSRPGASLGVGLGLALSALLVRRRRR